jgi:UDP-N-acetylmuramate dehydrogenase
MSSLRSQLELRFPNFPFQWNYALAQQTYFKIGGPAEAYIELRERQMVIDLVTFCRKEKVKLTIFGGASNIIVADEGVSGIVLKLINDDVKVDGTTVTAGAGIKTALLVRKMLDHELTGLEYFLGVPGNLGGAVFNNAHYLQHLLGDHITRVEVVGENGETYWLNHDECEFKYDYSRFHHTNEVILQAEFQLKVGNAEKSQELLKEATVKRATSQPLGVPSSGCIFQNAPMTPKLAEKFPQYKNNSHIGGGFLIDQAGLKGQREGDIVVSDKHAAFFVNEGEGTAHQAVALIKRVRQKVKEQFGVELQPEVFFLGMKSPFYQNRKEQ